MWQLPGMKLGMKLDAAFVTRSLMQIKLKSYCISFMSIHIDSATAVVL